MANIRPFLFVFLFHGVCICIHIHRNIIAMWYFSLNWWTDSILGIYLPIYLSLRHSSSYNYSCHMIWYSVFQARGKNPRNRSERISSFHRNGSYRKISGKIANKITGNIWLTTKQWNHSDLTSNMLHRYFVINNFNFFYVEVHL